MIFLLFNVVLFVTSIVLIFKAFINFQLILSLPPSIIFIFAIGLITPVMNLYDTIKNFVLIFTPRGNVDEDSL